MRGVWIKASVCRHGKSRKGLRAKGFIFESCSFSAESIPAVFTPLWPAGHLPLKGGDQLSPGFSPISGVAGKVERLKRLISPLEGEMAGRPEGGGGAKGAALPRSYAAASRVALPPAAVVSTQTARSCA